MMLKTAMVESQTKHTEMCSMFNIRVWETEGWLSHRLAVTVLIASKSMGGLCNKCKIKMCVLYRRGLPCSQFRSGSQNIDVRGIFAFSWAKASYHILVISLINNCMIGISIKHFWKRGKGELVGVVEVACHNLSTISTITMYPVS